MKALDEFKDKLNHTRPEQWDMIPDIELYMDQVISYMTRQHIGLELDGEENLTSAMINNYIKSGLLPRARGKKYNREHIGYLTAICLLKQVLSVSETGQLLRQQMENCSIEEFYRHYTEILDEEFSKTAGGDRRKRRRFAAHAAGSADGGFQLRADAGLQEASCAGSLGERRGKMICRRSVSVTFTDPLS